MLCWSSGLRTRAVAEAAGAAVGLAGGGSADGGQRRAEVFIAGEMRQGLSRVFSYQPICCEMLTGFMKTQLCMIKTKPIFKTIDFFTS